MRDVAVYEGELLLFGPTLDLSFALEGGGLIRMRLLINKLDGGANARITSPTPIIMRFYTSSDERQLLFPAH